MSTPIDQVLADLAALDAQSSATTAAANAAMVAAGLKITGSTARWQVTVDALSFRLSFGGHTTPPQTVAGLTTAALQAALMGLPSIGAGNAAVTGSVGGPFTVTLAGTLALTDQPVDALTGIALGGNASVIVTQVTQGVALAGSQFNTQAASAGAAFSSALAQDAGFRSDTQAGLDAAAGSVAAAANPASSATVISAIGSVTASSVSAPNVTSNPSSADVNSTDLTALLAGYTGSINTALGNVAAATNSVIAAIKAALGDVDAQVANGAIQHLKDAATSLQAVGQGFLDQVPPGADTEADKAAAYATLGNLLA